MRLFRSIFGSFQSCTTQRGFGDNMAIVYVFVLCCVASAALGILGWIKETKDERVRNSWEDSTSIEFRGQRRPQGYTITH
jgi:hypothetical protein